MTTPRAAGATSLTAHTSTISFPSAPVASSVSTPHVLSFSPFEAFPWLLGALACAVLITQFFEFAVIATLYRLQWHRGQSHQQLCLRFYQIYWTSAMLLFLGSLLWLYLTDRWAYKAAYGLVIFVVAQALQLSLAILLTSWQDIRERLHVPWLHQLLGTAAVTKTTVS